MWCGAWRPPGCGSAAGNKRGVAAWAVRRVAGQRRCRCARCTRACIVLHVPLCRTCSTSPLAAYSSTMYKASPSSQVPQQRTMFGWSSSWVKARARRTPRSSAGIIFPAAAQKAHNKGTRSVLCLTPRAVARRTQAMHACTHAHALRLRRPRPPLRRTFLVLLEDVVLPRAQRAGKVAAAVAAAGVLEGQGLEVRQGREPQRLLVFHHLLVVVVVLVVEQPREHLRGPAGRHAPA